MILDFVFSTLLFLICLNQESAYIVNIAQVPLTLVWDALIDSEKKGIQDLSVLIRKPAEHQFWICSSTVLGCMTFYAHAVFELKPVSPGLGSWSISQANCSLWFVGRLQLGWVSLSVSKVGSWIRRERILTPVEGMVSLLCSGRLEEKYVRSDLWAEELCWAGMALGVKVACGSKAKDQDPAADRDQATAVYWRGWVGSFRVPCYHRCLKIPWGPWAQCVCMFNTTFTLYEQP